MQKKLSLNELEILYETITKLIAKLENQYYCSQVEETKINTNCIEYIYGIESQINNIIYRNNL